MAIPEPCECLFRSRRWHGFPPPRGARIFLAPDEGGGGGDGDGGGDGEAGKGEGDVAALRTKVGEFRNENVKLRGAIETLEARLKPLEGLTPELIEALTKSAGTAKDEKEAKLLAAGKFDELLELRTAQIREEAKKALDERDGKLGKYQSQLGDTLRADTLRKAIDAKKLRLKPGAFGDVDRRAAAVFKPNDDLTELRPISDSSVDGLTVDKFLDDLVEKAGFLFEGGGGGGADGKDGGTLTTIRRSELNNENFSKHADAIASGKLRVIEG